MRALLPRAAPSARPARARRRRAAAAASPPPNDGPKTSGDADQRRTPLVDALRHRAADGAAPFHVPGHKRGQGAPPALLSLLGREALSHDLTELDGLDYLSAPRGAIAEAQALAALAFGAARTWFLVNGTSVGIHAAVLAACAPGDAVVLARNSHASALAAVALAGVVPFFAEAEADAELGVAHGVTPAAAAAALDAAAAACAAVPVSRPGRRAPRVALLLVVSPTYFGAAADVAALADVAHARGVPLAVDEAHGPHLAFAPRGSAAPPPALACGADLVIQSTHKTLAALTQAAMLHVSHGSRFSAARISAALITLQSSSPSYLLLASLDAARADAAAGVSVAASFAGASAARAALAAAAPTLRVLGPADVGRPGIAALDASRLAVGTACLGRSGYDVAAALAAQGVTPELVAPRCVVFLFGGGTSDADAARLVHALTCLAHDAAVGLDANSEPALPPLPPPPPLAMPPRAALFAARERVSRAAAVGRVSADTLCPYPPGIPVAFPGSVLTQQALDYVAAVLRAGGAVTGGADPSCDTLDIVAAADTPPPGASLWDA